MQVLFPIQQKLESVLLVCQQIVIVAALLLAFAWADTFEDDADFNDIFNAYPSYPAGAGRVGRAQPYYVPQPSPPAPQNYEKVYEKTYVSDQRVCVLYFSYLISSVFLKIGGSTL